MINSDPIKVLVVEDDANDYRLIAKQLQSLCRGVVIDWAETVDSAIEKLDRLSVDVILTDLSLPDSNQLSTVTRLRAKSNTLPIIVLTSLDDERLDQDLLESGVQDYVVKGDLSGRTLYRTILHAIQRQQMQNQLDHLLREREQDHRLLQAQASLLCKKNRGLRRLYNTAQEFVDNVSHDFRTPLTVIKDYVSIIREGLVGPINSEQETMLDKVGIRAEDLNHMVDDLLDLSKLEAGMLGAWRRNCSVHSILDRQHSMLMQRAQSRNVNLTLDCDTDLPEIYCDAEMIGRVITNLAVNAIKFSGEGGQVSLWARLDLAGQQVNIGITDNGPGIDDDSLKQIFERFRQLNQLVKSPVKGFGLGLNIAQHFCRINLGELQVESRIGEGSTFSFCIPLADPLEVFDRWLTTKKSSRDTLSVVDIVIPSETPETSADEFDSFLNCLLRPNDLLLRVRADVWLLVMLAPHSERNRWCQRAEEEYRRHNRNRPAGPLPSYECRSHGRWRSLQDREAILSSFSNTIELLAPVALTQL